MSPTIQQDDQQLQKQTATAADIAMRFVIISQETADAAARHLDGVIALRKEAESHHRKGIKKTYDAWQENLAMLKRVDEPLERAEKFLRSKLGTWAVDQQREREAEQRRIEAEERKRRNEEAERIAEEAMAQGASEAEVEAVMDQVMLAPAPVVPQAPRAPIVQGFTPRETWSAKVVDIKALCKAVADGTASPMFIEPNMTALNQMARAQKQTLNIPGVKAVPNATIAQGRK